MDKRFEELRGQMPVCGRCVYMDCAYDCGGSDFARAAAGRYFDTWAEAAAQCQRGGPGRESFFRLADETRGMICSLIGVSQPRGVAFTRNTNEGISHILMGFDDFHPGDNIVTLDIEHPSVLMPCLNAARLRDIECRIVEAEGGQYPSAQRLMEACDGRTRMMVISHVQSSNGCRADLPRLGAFCRSRGIYLVADAIQSLGFSTFEGEKWGLSAVTAGGYKGLLAGESCAFLWCDEPLLAHIWPVYTAAGMAMTVDREQTPWGLKCTDPTWARKLENSSLDAPGIYMLNAGIARVLELGTDNIQAHIRAMYEALYDGLTGLGIRPVTPREPEGSCAAIAFDVPDKEGLFRAMMDRGVVITCSRLVRISLGAFNNMDDVSRTIEGLKEALAMQKHR